MHNWIIIASGPSMSQIDMEVVRKSGWKVMAVNNSYKLAPWADALYAGDLAWWERYGSGLDFKGQRYTRIEVAAKRYGATITPERKGDGLCTTPMCVHTGGNSGFQSLNLAYHLGARRIVLLGFDMQHTGGRKHWHPDHEHITGKRVLNCPDAHIREWIKMFRPLARDLASQGVEVINCTPDSALPWFEKLPLEVAIAH